MQGVIATLGLGGIIQQLHQTGMAAEKLRNSFEVATGGATNGANALAFVRGEANRLGLDLESTAGAFLKLSASAKGTSLEGQKAQQIFTSVATAGRALGLSADEMSGALTAVSQMISKGTVQSEELRGQLGERLPGAFQIAARAMGVSTSELGKMLEQGQVISDEFLPKFAAELQKTFPAGEKAVSGLTAETSRLKTAWFELNETVMATGGETVFTAALRMLKKDLESVKGLFTSINDLYQLIRHPLTKQPSKSKPVPMNSFDAAVMGIGQPMSPGGDSDWRFRAGQPTPQIAPTIAATSTIVKNNSLLTDDQRKEIKRIGTAADKQLSKAEKSNTALAELWGAEIGATGSAASFRFGSLDRLSPAMGGPSLLGGQPEFYGTSRTPEDIRNDLAARESAISLQSARIAEQEAAGAITATEAMRLQVELLREKGGIMEQQLATMPKSSSEEISAYNGQAEAIANLNTQLNEMQKTLRMRDGWEGLKQGLQDYADSATNLGAQIKDAMTGALSGLETSLTNFVQTGKMSFKDLANSIIEDLIRIAIRASITGPLAQAMGGMMGGMFTTQAMGGVWQGGVQKFATGGLVVRPTFFGTSSGMGVMGEAGPEAIMPLARTGSGHLGVRTAGGGQQQVNVAVNVINQTGQPVNAKTGGMQFDGKQFIISTILENVQNNGPLRGLMAGGGAY
jgi:tape measure domain-containing protein